MNAERDHSRGPILSRTAVAITAVALLVTTFIVASSQRVIAQRERMSEPVSTFDVAASLPSVPMLKAMAVGHDEAAADLLWLSALSFYGAHPTSRDSLTWLDPYLETITSLDPHFALVYQWLGTVVMYGGRIDRESILRSNEILEQGVEAFPLDWNLHFMLGVNYVYELRPETEEERLQWRRKGAEHLRIAGGLPGAPPYLALAGPSVLRRTGDAAATVESANVALMTDLEAAELVSVRRLIERSVHPHVADATYARRRVLNALRSDPELAFGSGLVGMTVLPDPAYAIDVAALQPNPFPQTR